MCSAVYLAKRAEEKKGGPVPECLYFSALSACSAVYLAKRSNENKEKKEVPFRSVCISLRPPRALRYY